MKQGLDNNVMQCEIVFEQACFQTDICGHKLAPIGSKSKAEYDSLVRFWFEVPRPSWPS